MRQTALQIADGNLSERVEVTTRDEIGELGRAFNAMADRLERMIRGGRQLTASVSHELRTPLARIRVTGELLGEGLEQGRHDVCRQRLDEIREDIDELDHLIDRILALSKLEIHEMPFKSERLSASGMMEELLEKVKAAAQQKNLTIRADVARDAPLLGDREALHTAFGNTLDNAVKFTVPSGQILVRMDAESNGLAVSVTNTSRALSEDDRARIFDPFYRIEGSRAPGSGLGLAITKRIIEKHGGTIEASNSPEGLRIKVRLPIEAPARAEEG